MTRLGRPITVSSPQGQKIHQFLVREAGVPADATHVTLAYGVGDAFQITAVTLARMPPGAAADESATPKPSTP